MSDQGPEPLVLFLSLLLYLGFELSFRSMDFPADITLRKTRMKFELTFKVVLLFSYQGFQLSLAKSFIFYHITLFLSRTFLKKTFFIFFRRFLLFAMRTFIYYHMIFNLSRSFFVFFQDFYHFSFKNVFLMCNAYYIIIIAELRQAFFEDFFILSTSTRYCTFFVFL